jgi:hypothetical protein
MLPNRKSAGLAVAAVTVAAGLGTATPAFAKTLRASMKGGATEKPDPGDPNGTGTARITTNAAKGRVCYRISLKRVGTVGAGHIHTGKAGTAGDIAVLLFKTPTKRPRGCVKAKKSLIRKIERNPSRYYVNVHTAKFPGGAVRGQLR